MLWVNQSDVLQTPTWLERRLPHIAWLIKLLPFGGLSQPLALLSPENSNPPIMCVVGFPGNQTPSFDDLGASRGHLIDITKDSFMTLSLGKFQVFLSSAVGLGWAGWGINIYIPYSKSQDHTPQVSGFKSIDLVNPCHSYQTLASRFLQEFHWIPDNVTTELGHLNSSKKHSYIQLA